MLGFKRLPLAFLGALGVVCAGWAYQFTFLDHTRLVLGALPPGVARSSLNVLLITLDTTRADHLGAYGFQSISTPNIDRLAREGV